MSEIKTLNIKETLRQLFAGEILNKKRAKQYSPQLEKGKSIRIKQRHY